MFLTQNFVDSGWCRHEFRVAQVEAAHERRNRIIVITYDNIEESDLMDTELKTYLRLHLYIKYEDLQFWPRLLYAMPHRSPNQEMPIRNDEIRMMELPRFRRRSEDET